MTDAATVHDWQTGLRLACEAVARHLATTDRVLVGVTGPVGSGKTTFAKRLIDPADAGSSGGLLLSTDHYLPDYQDAEGRDRMPPHERDLPRHADLPLLVRHLADLREGRPVDRPTWSFLTHRREGTELITPPARGVIAVEGIHALSSVGDAEFEPYHLCVFIETPAAMRKQRFVQRDADGDRGMGVDESSAFFDTIADPTFERFADEYRARAHLIVRGDAGEP